MSQGASSGNINVSLKCLSSFAWVKRVKRISLINPHFPSFIRLKSHSGIHRRLSKSRKFDFLHYQHAVLKERKASTVESAKPNVNRNQCCVRETSFFSLECDHCELGCGRKACVNLCPKSFKQKKPREPKGVLVYSWLRR